MNELVKLRKQISYFFHNRIAGSEKYNFRQGEVVLLKRTRMRYGAQYRVSSLHMALPCVNLFQAFSLFSLLR